MSSLVGLILCQIGNMLGLSWSIWHIHSLATFRHFSLTKIKFDMFHILLAKNEVVQPHANISEGSCIGWGKPTRDANQHTIYIYMCVCMSVCVYKPVLQQWQRLVFSGCQTSAGWKPKTNILFIKKTPRIQMQDQTNKMLNQKLYKQWLNIKFASCIGLEKIWKNFEFMGVHGCSWVLMGSLFMCVCLSLFLQPPFLGDKKIKRRSLSDCSTLGLIVFCLFLP